METIKATFDDSLQQNVVLTGKCLGCAACTVVCPFRSLEYVEGEPRLTKECKACGICASVCPQFRWPLSEVERRVFGRERRCDEEFGVYRRIAVGKAKDYKLLGSCQDGGVVSALLLHVLKTKLIDGAVVTGFNEQKPFYPVPRLVTTFEAIIESAGTRYSYSPNPLALLEVARQKRKSIAFVGTPCQINALRSMQLCRLKPVANVKLLIGLMCSECFTYEGLMEKHIHENLGINLNDIKSINIKGKVIVKLKSGSSIIIPLVDIKQYARKSCGFCRDFSSELSDISVGGLGLDGWTFTVARTNEGEVILDSAEKTGMIEIRPVEKRDPTFSLLVKLSKKKHRLNI